MPNVLAKLVCRHNREVLLFSGKARSTSHFFPQITRYTTSFKGKLAAYLPYRFLTIPVLEWTASLGPTNICLLDFDLLSNSSIIILAAS